MRADLSSHFDENIQEIFQNALTNRELCFWSALYLGAFNDPVTAFKDVAIPVIRVPVAPTEDGGSTFLINVGICLQVHMALQPITTTTSTSSPL
jgi:hypothetical protein